MCGEWSWTAWLALFAGLGFLWFLADTIATVRENKKCEAILRLMRQDLIALGARLTEGP